MRVDFNPSQMWRPGQERLHCGEGACVLLAGPRSTYGGGSLQRDHQGRCEWALLDVVPRGAALCRSTAHIVIHKLFFLHVKFGFFFV